MSKTYERYKEHPSEEEIYERMVEEKMNQYWEALEEEEQDNFVRLISMSEEEIYFDNEPKPAA